ncbi:phage late control D family protein [Glutamicibacter soli]|uniref:Phage late control D family protein n=1 Tax=Glutamicibacter soli TaxID=453836 RepID=A0A6L9G2H1_9MICC|nr:phage late control D family protein [Glutamicibacter soli]NAZ14730.1 hypothetical protein [Glutamicibacter soli]
MSENPIGGRFLHTPAFRLLLNGQDTGRIVANDVMEASFTEQLGAISCFEFTLYDWDAVALRPRYSSPWDQNGVPLPLDADSGRTVPNFEPGAAVELYFGYVDEGELPLMLRGEVVSLNPSFPASGTPTCRVRALDAFARKLQKIHVEGNYDGTDRGIVDRLCTENQVTVSWAEPLEEGESRSNVVVDGTLYDQIATRAETYGYVVFSTATEEPGLLLAPPSAAGSEPAASLHWGRDLHDFTPALSTAAQVSEVVVRLADPDAEDQDRQREITRSFSDIGLDPSALGPGGSGLDAAVRGIREILKPDEALSEADAIKAADRRLRELAADLITGSGSTVGLPELRAGKMVRLSGMGARFEGNWRLTKTVHTLGASGYTTSFEARKEVLTS